jgi:arsenate reductase (glutaredoxin)
MMERVTLYHNPGWSHSRSAVALLTERGVEFDTIEYLKTPPTRETLERIIAMLEGPVTDLIRKDRRFEELKLREGDYTTRETVISLLLDRPELMQRPIVIRGGRAIIARPANLLGNLFWPKMMRRGLPVAANRLFKRFSERVRSWDSGCRLTYVWRHRLRRPALPAN